MEKSTRDGEYIDIVLGYHHVLLFSLVFGVLIFGTGYFVGFRQARTDHDTQSAASTGTRVASRVAGTPTASPGLIPQIVAEPFVPDDVVKDMKKMSTASLTVGRTTDGEPVSSSIAAAELASAASPEAASPEAGAPTPSTTSPLPTSEAKPAVSSPVEVKKSEPVSTDTSSGPSASSVVSSLALPKKPAPPSNAAGGDIYLQVSAFGAQQEAEKLLDDLAAEGFRALIDGSLVEGKHTVLVGPFADFQDAAGQAKELREHNREAFPIRR